MIRRKGKRPDLVPFFCCLLLALAPLVAGCSSRGPASTANLDIINESGAAIGTISVKTSRTSEFGQNADNSLLTRGERLGFNVEGTNTFVVEFYQGFGPSLGKPFYSEKITWDFTQGKCTLRLVDQGGYRLIIGSGP